MVTPSYFTYAIRRVELKKKIITKNAFMVTSVNSNITTLNLFIGREVDLYD